jgi:hypothetical protein
LAGTDLEEIMYGEEGLMSWALMDELDEVLPETLSYESLEEQRAMILKSLKNARCPVLILTLHEELELIDDDLLYLDAMQP